MTDKEKVHLAHEISQELIVLEKNIIALQKLCVPIAPECALGDLARFELMHDQEVSNKSLIQAETRKTNLQYALIHINKEDFGLCAQCEEEINYARLLLLPESRLCIQCASKLSS